jgi:DNA-binding transcriptional ArsR family regulator
MQTDEALFTRTRAAVLALFLLNPRQRFYLREVVRRLGMGQGTVQKELARLRRAGLLAGQKEGRRSYFKANTECFVFEDLRGLVDRTVGPVGKLHEALRTLRPVIAVAFIYGSVANDSATAASDVDLMIVGEVDFDEVLGRVRPVQDELGREVNASVFSREEFVAKLRARTPFLENVMAGPKRFVIGDQHDLAQLA